MNCDYVQSPSGFRCSRCGDLQRKPLRRVCGAVPMQIVLPPATADLRPVARLGAGGPYRASKEADRILQAYCLCCDKHPCLAYTPCGHAAELKRLDAVCPFDRWRGRPKVAILTPSLNLGGAERWAVDLRRRLDRSALDVLGLGVLSGRCEPQLLHQAAIDGPVYVGRAACGKLLAESQIMICWGIRDLPAESPPCVVYAIHGTGGGKDHVQGLLASGVAVVAVSRWAGARAAPDVDLPVLYNGIEPARLIVRRGREKTRRLWGIEPDDLVIGHIGRLSHEKGSAATAVAAEKLGPPWRSLFVGRSDAFVQQTLRDLDPGAVFVGPIEDIGEAYAAIDVFMLASRSEAHSLSLTEAWMAGVPAVATRVGAVPELEAGQGLLVVPVEFQDSPEHLAAAVLAAIAPDNKPVVDRAKAFAEVELTAEAMGRRWTDYLIQTWRKHLIDYPEPAS